jgi:hypothetical protein
VYQGFKTICTRRAQHKARGPNVACKAFNLTRETPNLVYFASFFDNNTLECVKGISTLVLGYVKKILTHHEI